MLSPRHFFLLCSAITVLLLVIEAHRHHGHGFNNHHHDHHHSFHLPPENHNPFHHNPFHVLPGHHNPFHPNPFHLPPEHHHPEAPTCNGIFVNSWSLTFTSTYQTCPLTSCYESYSKEKCCMNLKKGVKQCLCSQAVMCPTTNVNTPPAPATVTTLSTTTTTSTTITTTSSTTTPNTTPTTTTTTTSSTPTPPTTTATMTTTTMSTTTTRKAPLSLCQPAFRLLNGVLVNNDCAFAGIANITNSLNRVACNAVLTTATVNGTLKKTFLTSSYCKGVITAKIGGTPDISIGNQIYPLQEPIFTVTDGPNGNAFLTVNDRYANLFSDLGPCQKTACAYNPVTMSSKVDFNDCKVISWGAHETSSYTQGGEYEVSVKMNLFGCTSIKNLFGANTTMCFTTTSGQNAFASGDSGAPLYCRAPSNGEWILMGVTAFQTISNSTSDLKVIPFPG